MRTGTSLRSARFAVYLVGSRTGTMKYLTCLVVVVPLACAPGHNRVSTRTLSWEQAERDAEYSVYSHLLRGQSRPIIVNDSTSPMSQGRQVYCSQPDLRPGSCIEPPAGTSVEMWEDFAEKNRQAWLIEPRFDPSINVVMKRDAKLPEADCSGPRINYFSRVGFNLDLTQAVVRITTITGKGPMPGCGFATGTRIMLQKTETGWKTFGNQAVFIS